MATNYTGLPYPPIEQDNPPPLPGTAPVVSIPVDADPNNVATMFTNQYRMLADHQAHMSAAIKARAPVTPGTTLTGTVLQCGFTNVVHVGPGTGTIALPELNFTNGDQRVVIKISTSGGLGVGFFQWSNDAGATYNAAIVIPGGGTHTDGVSNISVVFAGTFTALDTYSFQPSDTPRVRSFNSVSESPAVDHLGFRETRRGIHTDWGEYGLQQVIAATTNPIAGAHRMWGVNIVGGAGNTVTIPSGPGNVPGMTVDMAHTANAGNRATIHNSFLSGGAPTLFSSGGPGTQSTGKSIIVTFDWVPLLLGSGSRFFGGLTSLFTDCSFGISVLFGGFYVVNGVTTTTPSPVAIPDLVRIEFHYQGGPWSTTNHCLRVFVNNKCIYSRDTAFGGNLQFGLGFGAVAVSGVGAGQYRLGPVSLQYGRLSLSEAI